MEGAARAIDSPRAAAERRPSALAGTDVRATWGMLVLRPTLAVSFQAAVALGFVVGGAADPWRAAADWWLGWFAAVSVVNLVALRWLLHREGRRLRDLYRFDRTDRWADLRWVAAALLVAGPIAMLPSVLIGQALWGTSEVAADLSFRAIPVAGAVIILIGFPVVHALAELPTYFGYVMPRLEATYGWRWRALAVTGTVLALQHVALPLLFDAQFIVWRALMFLPFALWMGFVIQRRPTTLPYLVIAHGLLDLSLPILVLTASLS
jgi:hypothetical protein